MRSSLLFSARLACMTLAVGAAMLPGAYAASTPVQTVASVDTQRYVGKWYEIANYPMFFQRKCVGDTTAEYTARPDGKISVVNRCRTKDGEFDQAEGEARAVEGSNNTKLKVTFFKPFSGDYWIIGLDPEYRWAVVGSPDRKYLWVLSRTATMDAADLERALDAARAQGYTLEELRYTPQDGKTSEPRNAS